MKFGKPEEVFRVIEIEALNRMKDDIVVQIGIGGAGGDMDVMAQIFQGTADALYIDPLSAAGGVAPISEQAYSERPVFFPSSRSCWYCFCHHSL